MEKLLLSIPDAARTVSISRSALYELLAENAVRSVKHGRKRLVDAGSLKQWAATLPESPLNLAPKGGR